MAPQEKAPEPAADRRSGVGFDQIPGIISALQPSVVAILAEGPQGGGEGSGVVWNGDGVVVTNNHVVEGATDVEVALASGERVAAEVTATDPRTDLAIVTAARNDLPPARFAATRPTVGQLAIAMGNPLGFENSATAGIVSGLDRAVPSGGQTPALVGLVQTDAAISPGNSGGALVGADREVIGINVAYIPPQANAVAIGFAIPSPLVIEVVEQLLEDGEVNHAYLGVQLNQLTPEIAQQFGIDAEGGAIAVDVVRGGPAAKAGMEPGDVIVEIEGEPVEVVEDVYAALRGGRPDESMRMVVLREGERRPLTVELGERPSTPARSR
jgi:S1-C subfamily serine protease